jgi:hypothetical protein
MFKDLPKTLLEAAEVVLTGNQLPCADISHHKSKDQLLEQDLSNWTKQHTNYENPDLHKNVGRGSVGSFVYGAEDEHKELADEHVSNLEPHEHDAANAYITGGLESGHESGSKEVNTHLIESYKNGTVPKKHFEFGEDEEYKRTLNLDDLDSAVTKNKHPKKLVTYSGIGFDPGEHVGEKGVLHLPAYTSSSTNKAVALMYTKGHMDSGRHVLEIHHPKGSTGLYIGDNDYLSPFGHKEHIMPRNSRLKIDKEPTSYFDNNGETVNVWKATRFK